MKILQVKKFPLYDIFQDEGWYAWSRYLLKKGKLIYVGGAKILDRAILSQIVNTIKDAESN